MDQMLTIDAQPDDWKAGVQACMRKNGEARLTSRYAVQLCDSCSRKDEVQPFNLDMPTSAAQFTTMLSRPNSSMIRAGTLRTASSSTRLAVSASVGTPQVSDKYKATRSQAPLSMSRTTMVAPS